MILLGKLLALCAIPTTTAFLVPAPSKEAMSALFVRHWALDETGNNREWNGVMSNEARFRDNRGRATNQASFGADFEFSDTNERNVRRSMHTSLFLPLRVSLKSPSLSQS